MNDASTPEPNVRHDIGGWISGPCAPGDIPDGYHVTFAPDSIFPDDWWADLRNDETGRVIETGSGTTKEAARAHLLERYARHEAGQ